jgi:hypothetical protein
MIKLYQFAPAFGLPNASPFCMKVENYLRMTGNTQWSSPQRECVQGSERHPYIEDNANSLLTQPLLLNTSRRLTAMVDLGERGAEGNRAHLQRLLEENSYWPWSTRGGRRQGGVNAGVFGNRRHR